MSHLIIIYIYIIKFYVVRKNAEINLGSCVEQPGPSVECIHAWEIQLPNTSPEYGILVLWSNYTFTWSIKVVLVERHFFFLVLCEHDHFLLNQLLVSVPKSFKNVFCVTLNIFTGIYDIWFLELGSIWSRIGLRFRLDSQIGYLSEFPDPPHRFTERAFMVPCLQIMSIMQV